jgi:serpin B
MSFALLLTLSACLPSTPVQSNPDSPAPAPAPAPQDAVNPSGGPSVAFANLTNQFGEDLWHELPAEGNLVISPASLSLALAMTASGARGETAEQMLQALHLDGDSLGSVQAEIGALLASWNEPRDTYQLSVANRLFGEKTAPFEAPFLQLTAERFGAPLEPADFKGAAEPSRAQINKWVSDKTRGQIAELLPSGSVDSDTRLVLANALYFEGRWEQAFEPTSTRAARFQTGGGEEVQVPTLHQSATFGYASLADVKVLEMPYAGGDLVMDLVLPHAADGLGALLAEGDTERWLSALQPTQVDVALPKLDLSMDEPLELETALTALGMAQAFREEADFTGIAKLGEPFYIDDVYHMTTLKLDEAGTEASAATGAVMTRVTSAAPAPAEKFTADHPFLFLLRDARSGAVLFLGRVVDPR